MKFGVLANPMRPILEEIDRIASLGFDFVELTFEPPQHMPGLIASQREAILAKLQECGMFLVGHAAFWLDFSSIFEPVRVASLAEAKKMIALDAQLGIEKQNFHGFHRGLDIHTNRRAVLDRFVASLRELVAFGKQHRVDVMFENSPAEKGRIFGDIDDFTYVFRRTPGLLFHLDIGHAQINAEGLERVEAMLKRFRKKLVHIHIHDNFGEADDHLPLGVAKLDYQAAAKLLLKAKYDGTVTFEIFTRDPDMVKDSMLRFRQCLEGKKH